MARNGSGYTIKITGIDNVLHMLKSLPPEVVSKRGGPVKASLRKGAVIIQKQAKANIARIVATPNKGGPPYSGKGDLEKAVIVTRGRYNRSGEKYIVWLGRGAKRAYANTRFNRSKQQVGKTYEEAPPQFYGRFLEFGTSHQSAQPWALPAFKEKANEAMNTIVTDLVDRIDKIVKKLARQRK